MVENNVVDLSDKHQEELAPLANPLKNGVRPKKGELYEYSSKRLTLEGIGWSVSVR